MAEHCGDQEFYFQWHITERCNQRCAHCYHTSYDGSGDLSSGDLDRCLDEMERALAAWGRTGSFSLTGGEPFMRRDDLFHLMGRLDSSPSVAYYDILTNGSLITRDDLGRLQGAERLRRVQVSLEAPTAEDNDRVRGPGSFRRTLDAIDVLKGADLEVAVMQTVARGNVSTIPDMVELLAAHRVDCFSIERFVPEGAGAALRDYALSQAEVRDLFTAIHRLALAERRVRILMYRPLFALLDRLDPTVGAMCSVGTNALTVMHDGTVYPCRRLPIPLGNILNDGLFRIWYDSEFLWQVRDAKSIDGCGECELVPLCRGCRAMAYHVSGNAFARDPHCWQETVCTG